MPVNSGRSTVAGGSADGVLSSSNWIGSGAFANLRFIRKARLKGRALLDVSKSTNVAPSSSAIADSIPGFGGVVFAPDTPGYDAKRAQYASSSYPEKQAPEGPMHPFLIA